VDEKLTAFLELESAICARGELPRQAGQIFPKLPGYENTHSTSSNYNCTCLLCAFTKSASSCPGARRRLSRRQHCGGTERLFSLTTGGFNTAVGFFSLRSDTTGPFNTAIGAGTLLANTAGSNTATGAGALLSNTTANGNTANGAVALLSNTTGPGNTANGAFALGSNTKGNANTAIGDSALQSNTTGGDNTANGLNALLSNATGNSNTANGVNALRFNTTGSNNIALGVQAGSGVSTASNVIAIGIAGADVSDTCFIGNIFGNAIGGAPVTVTSEGQVRTGTSSRRFKDDIKPMDKASEALYALKPVRFRYKKAINPVGASQFGLVAEDVEKVNPDLVVRDKERKPYTVCYDQVNAMLLNEFLKEHRKVEEQEKTIVELKSGMAALISPWGRWLHRLVRSSEVSCTLCHRVVRAKRTNQVVSILGVKTTPACRA
jgi:hypothetical protein